MSRYIDADLTDSAILNAVQEETADGDTFIIVRRILNKFQTADVAPIVHGKWIERWHENKHVIGDMACSVCGAQMLLTFPKYCPECGAKMDNNWSRKQIKKG